MTLTVDGYKAIQDVKEKTLMQTPSCTENKKYFVNVKNLTFNLC
jgi:hypothetical protein